VGTTAHTPKAPPAVPAAPVEYDKIYEDLKPWEGFCKWMYLDTAKPPKVTVGVGNMLPNVAAAQALPFINASTNKTATKEEVATAFNAVSKMKGALSADKYKLKPSIEINEQQAKDWAIARLKNEFLPQLRRFFKGFDNFPLPAREALIDMIYNMGIGHDKRIVKAKKKGEEDKVEPARGLASYVALVRAVRAEDWQTASLHCWRKPSNTKHPEHAEARNAWTKKRFEDAERLSHPQQVATHPAGAHQ